MGNPKAEFASRKKAPGVAVSHHLLASGENVTLSGIYKVQHHATHIHQVEKELFIPKGTTLPPCTQCRNPLKFRLIMRVDYIAEDPDFK